MSCTVSLYYYSYVPLRCMLIDTHAGFVFANVTFTFRNIIWMYSETDSRMKKLLGQTADSEARNFQNSPVFIFL
jgi:hypothetical protein